MQTTADPAQLFGSEVLDSQGKKVGSVDNVWVDDATNELEFIGVKTGFLMGKIHVIPMANAQIADGTITVPYTESQIKDAPSASGDAELSPDEEDEIYSSYGIDRSTEASPTGLPPGGTSQSFQTDTREGRSTTDSAETEASRAGTGMAAQDDRAGLTLSEEELQVGKREVETGRVRLRKVVRTEHQEVPVELRREEVQIERVDASDATVPGDAFKEQEIEVPVMREEAVVAKEAHVTGGVRLNKDTTTETETVKGEVRKEDVDIDDNADISRTNTR